MKKTLTLKHFITVVCLALSINYSTAEIINTVIVRGKIKKFDSKTVTVVDRFNQQHKVAREKLKDFPMVQGQNVSFNVNIKTQKLNKFDYKIKIDEMKPEQKKKLYNAYIQFIIHNEMKNKGIKTSWMKDLMKKVFELVLPEAAIATPGDLNCVYAGWPSVYQNGTCLAPWSSAARTAGAVYHTCGRGDAIRCNPDLFGAGDQITTDGSIASTAVQSNGSSNVRVYGTADHEHGICVQASASSNVTERCLKASRERYDMNAIVNNMTAERFNAINSAIDGFCNSSRRNSSCAHLEERITEIRVASLPVQKVCQVVSDNGPQTGSTCRSVVVRCRQGESEFQGYLPAAQVTALGSSAREAGSRLSIDGNLSTDQCGADSNDLVSSRSQCTGINRITDLGYNADQMGDSNGATGGIACEGRQCVTTSNCLATSDSSPDANLIYEVSMVCECNVVRDERVSEAERISMCSVFTVPQMSPIANPADVTPAFRGDAPASGVGL